MELFFAILLLLYILSWFPPFSQSCFPFDKETSIALKGVLSLLIVAHHLSYHVDSWFFSLFHSWGASIVSLFFFIAGYGLMVSFMKNPSYLQNGFFRKRMWKVIKPFLGLTVLFVLLRSWDEHTISTSIFYDLLVRGIPPLPNSWFVFTIVLLYCFFYALFRLLSISIHLKIAILFLLSFLYILFVKEIGYDRNWWVAALAFPTGVLYAYKEKIIVAYSRLTIYKLMFFPSVCLILGAIMYSHIEILLIIAYVLIPLLTINLLSYVHWGQRRFIFLGSISYEIYLFHGMFIYLLRRNTLHVESDALYILLVYVSTIVSSYVLYRLLNNRFLYKK